MNFQKININEWQQFLEVDIDFHNKLTILTGANGSGKTTILSHILARHNQWNIQSLSTPKKDKKSGVFSFLTRLFNGEDKSDNNLIGYLQYDGGHKAELRIPNQNSPQYQIDIKGQQGVKCFFIPSHRTIFRYQPISNIPFAKKNKGAAFQEVNNATRDRYIGGSSQPSSFFMKNTLIGWAIQGYGVKKLDKVIMPSDEEQIRNYEGFKDVLKKILPETLGFEEFEIREREIVFVCNRGKDEFVLEQASGGISALIDIAWTIYMFSTKEITEFTVLIDEIENHLHPTMQRQILPDLLNAFPKARFIVTTHSPLIVGSVRESNVYVLKYNEDKKIISRKLDLINQAKTASEILDEVLGVSVTLPIWAEEELIRIVDKYSIATMTKETFGEMRNDLKSIGLESLMPEAISKLIEINDD